MRRPTGPGVDIQGLVETFPGGRGITVRGPKVEYRPLTFVYDGMGSVITANKTCDIRLLYNCRLVSWSIVAQPLAPATAGSVTLGLWNAPFVEHPPTAADKITGSVPPQVVNGVRGEDDTLAGWNRLLAKGSVLRANTDSVASLMWLALTLRVEVL